MNSFRGQLTPETLEKILAPFDEAVEKMGFESWEALSQYLRDGVKLLGPGFLESTGKSLQFRIKGEIKPDPPGEPALHEVVLAIDTREKLIQLFERNREPTAWELKQVLKLIKKVLGQYRSALLRVAKVLPHDPGGQPEFFRTQEERAAVYDRIKKYQDEDGISLWDAQQHLVNQTGAKRHTVERTWQREKQRRGE